MHEIAWDERPLCDPSVPLARSLYHLPQYDLKLLPDYGSARWSYPTQHKLILQVNNQCAALSLVLVGG